MPGKARPNMHQLRDGWKDDDQQSARQGGGEKGGKERHLIGVLRLLDAQRAAQGQDRSCAAPERQHAAPEESPSPQHTRAQQADCCATCLLAFKGSAACSAETCWIVYGRCDDAPSITMLCVEAATSALHCARTSDFTENSCLFHLAHVSDTCPQDRPALTRVCADSCWQAL